VLLVGVAIYIGFGLVMGSRGSAYDLTVLSLLAVNVVLAAGFSIVYSQSGQFSFATFGFYAVGGFTYAWFSEHTNPEFAMVMAALAAGVVGLLVRLGTARLSRLYFAIASLSIGALILIVFQNWDSISGGVQGIGPIKPITFGLVDKGDPAGVFKVAWVVSAVTVLLIGLLYRSAWSRDLLIVRDMRQVGRNDAIPVRRLELESFVVGSATAGLAGALLASTNVFISIDSFSVSVSLQVLIMVVLGGAGGVLGPIIGAAVVTELPEQLRSYAKWSGVGYGIAILVIFIALPEGVMGIWARLLTRLKIGRREPKR
jgi:ABC-type branched-subunit amino acid transport system permease subunit